jgi:hypothetical protein
MHLQALSGAFSEDGGFVIGCNATGMAEKRTASGDLPICPYGISSPLLLVVELPFPL